MKSTKLYEIVDNQMQHCVAVLQEKAAEYVLGDDHLEHFKTSALMQEMTPKQALWGMAAKHITSINKMCNTSKINVATGMAWEKKFKSELWREKITDAMNYMLLLWALVLEEAEPDD